MVLYEMVHNSDVLVGMVGGGIDGKVSTIGASENNLGPTTDKEGIEMLSMVVLMVWMKCTSVSYPCGS